MQAKENKFLTAMKVIRWLRYGLFFVVLILLGIIFLRFSILYLPDTVGDFPGQSYVLMDWKYQYGRQLEAKDWVAYNRPGYKNLQIAEIKGFNEDKSYVFLQPHKEQSVIVQATDTIHARMIMAIFQGSPK